MLKEKQIIRTSVHSTKFANVGKLNNLNMFINEYRICAQYMIDYIWSNGYEFIDSKKCKRTFDIEQNLLELPSMLLSSIVSNANIETILTGRALKCCMTQVSGIIRAETEKQRKRINILNKLKIKKQPRRQRQQLINKLKKNIPVKPNASNIFPELNSICADFKIKDNDFSRFDGFIRLKSITKTKLDIKIPIKFSKHSKRLMENGVLKPSFLIGKNKIDLRWDINIKPKITGKTVGADQGMKTVLSFSDNQITPKKDIHGNTLESIIDKKVRRVRGSKSFKRAQDQEVNFINWSINQINFSNIQQVNLEEIKNINYKNKTSSKMFYWRNTLIRDKMCSRCELLGVQVKHQSSTYRSQRCSCCGMVKKSNRKGKTYTCSNCGLIIDSDINASRNHEQSIPEIPYSFSKFKLNRIGFFWLETGLFDLKGESLQSLLPENT